MLVRVTSTPTNHNKSIGVVAEVLEIRDSTNIIHNCNGKIQLYFQKPSDIVYGDEILVLATPQRPSAADNPHQFDYRRHLARKGILYTDYVNSSRYRITGHNEKGLMSKVNRLRMRLVDVIRFSSLTPSQQGIAEALFLGWDDDIGDDTRENFKRSGITHLLCVSGLHVGILTMLVGYCLFFISNRKRGRIIKGVIQLAVIWTFVILTGMAPGTVRAGLMFSFITVGRMFFSAPPTLNAIAASALVMLVAKPLLLFDVGFELSYCAVFGIVLFVRPLESLIPLPFEKDNSWKVLLWLLRKVRSLFCVSVVAQISTAPLIIYYFHQFPIYFLVANMIIIPFAGLILGSVMMMVAFAWWPWAFAVIGKVLSFELGLTELVTSSVASWPGAMIDNICFNVAMLVLAFVAVAALGFLLLSKHPAGLVVALSAAIAIIIIDGVEEKKAGSQRHYDIYNVGRRIAAEFFVGHRSTLVCDSATAKKPQSIDFQTQNNLLYRRAKRTRIVSLTASYSDSLLSVEKGTVIFDGDTIELK